MRIQSFKQFNPVEIIQPQRMKLVIPAFSYSPQTWIGASLIIAEFAFNNTDYWFSLRMPIAHFGANFIPAVRFVDVANSVVYRYKLYDDSRGILFYPVYFGDALGLNAVLEIWSVNTTSAPVLTAPVTLQGSVLAFPNTCGVCCTNPSLENNLAAQSISTINAYAYCNPFCLPLGID